MIRDVKPATPVPAQHGRTVHQGDTTFVVNHATSLATTTAASPQPAATPSVNPPTLSRGSDDPSFSNRFGMSTEKVTEAELTESTDAVLGFKEGETMQPKATQLPLPRQTTPPSLQLKEAPPEEKPLVALRRTH